MKNKITTSPMLKVDKRLQSVVLCSHGYMPFHHNTAELTGSYGGDIPYIISAEINLSSLLWIQKYETFMTNK